MNNNNNPELVFIKQLSDLFIKTGESCRFTVRINKPFEGFKIKWMCKEKEIIASDRLKIKSDSILGEYELEINQVTIEDEGEYTFQLEDTQGIITSKAKLFLVDSELKNGKSPEFIKGLKGFLWDNGTLSLECEVYGTPTPTLRWYKDGHQLLPGSALKIRANSKERRCFLGIFACEAENCHGSKFIYSKVYALEFGKFLKSLK